MGKIKILEKNENCFSSIFFGINRKIKLLKIEKKFNKPNSNEDKNDKIFIVLINICCKFYCFLLQQIQNGN